MASKTLYPPILKSYIPAFTGNSFIIPFEYSKFNSYISSHKAHVRITKISNGENMASSSYPNGVIINKTIENGAGSYYITISGGDVKNLEVNNIYKIQIRLSEVTYTGGSEAEWLKQNAGSFSEWSTIATTKCIGASKILLDEFGWDSSSAATSISATSNTLVLKGKYENTGTDEYIKSISIDITQNNILLDSISASLSFDATGMKDFLYKSKVLFTPGTYAIDFSILTNNYYQYDCSVNLVVSNSSLKSYNCSITTIESNSSLSSSVSNEQDEGRVMLCVKDEEKSGDYNYFVIKRTDSRSNFTQWEDIKTISYNGNDEYILYDYLIESDVWYQYGVQAYKVSSKEYTKLNIQNELVIREFEYCYLLGRNEQQLRLPYNTTVSNFKVAKADSVTETISGEYPIISRNGSLNYKSFSLGALISYNMDIYEDNKQLFLSDRDIYSNKEFDAENSIVTLYKNKAIQSHKGYYNYSKEREFRDKVQQFLQDGKAKLFKSPTEGNIVVYLSNVQFNGEQNLNRMIYSFTSTATEIGDYNFGPLKQHLLCDGVSVYE